MRLRRQEAMKTNKKRTFAEELERLHLQWFADPEPAEGEGDEDDEAAAGVGFTPAYEGEDFEIFAEGDPNIPPEEPETPPEPAPDPNEELKAKLEAMQQSMQQQGAGRDEQFAGVLSQLDQTLKHMNQPQTQAQAQVTEESLKKLREQMNETVFDKPMDNIDQYVDQKFRYLVQQYIAPEFQRMSQVAQSTAQATSKQMARQSDFNSIVLDEYGPEVEELVKSGQIQPGPSMYEEACQRVGMKHFNDITSKQFQRMMEQQTANGGGGTGSTAPAKGTQPGSAQGQGGSPPQGGRKRRAVLTAEQNSWVAQMENRGMDRKKAVQLLIDQGQVKMR